MSQPELKVLAYPEPFTKAELQELLNPFTDMSNVELQEITGEGGMFGLDLGFVCSAIVAGTLIKPFVEGFIKKCERSLPTFYGRDSGRVRSGTSSSATDGTRLTRRISSVSPSLTPHHRVMGLIASSTASFSRRKSTLIARDTMNSRPKGPASYMNLR
jgi:hypothetical protein